MFSDADPVVAPDPKQQHREPTKPGIYSGIPVAVSCLPKTNNTLCIALIFLENTFSPVCFCVRQKRFFFPPLVIKAPAVWLNLRYNSLHLNLKKERHLLSGDSRLAWEFPPL